MSQKCPECGGFTLNWDDARDTMVCCVSDCGFSDKKNDPINHPAHYTLGGIEVIDAIEAWQLGYHLGNVVKYVARARHKGAESQDLKKAKWYIERAIANLEPKL